MTWVVAALAAYCTLIAALTVSMWLAVRKWKRAARAYHDAAVQHVREARAAMRLRMEGDQP